MTHLCDLAIKYGTDKGPAYHNYTPTYFNMMCGTELLTRKVVEIGVMMGNSVKMWLDFFPDASIYAIDKDPEAFARLSKTNHTQLRRVIRLWGDEEDPSLWDRIGSEVDYVIDDGSHIPEHQMRMFERNFWRLSTGGLWIIEDTHCSFHVNFNGTAMGDDRLYPWLNKHIVAQQMGGGDTGNFYKAVEHLDSLSDLRAQIFGIRSYKSVIVFERA